MIKQNHGQRDLFGTPGRQDSLSFEIVSLGPQTFLYELVDPNNYGVVMDALQLTEAEVVKFNADRRQIGSDYRWVKSRTK